MTVVSPPNHVPSLDQGGVYSLFLSLEEVLKNTGRVRRGELTLTEFVPSTGLSLQKLRDQVDKKGNGRVVEHGGRLYGVVGGSSEHAGDLGRTLTTALFAVSNGETIDYAVAFAKKHWGKTPLDIQREASMRGRPESQE